MIRSWWKFIVGTSKKGEKEMSGTIEGGNKSPGFHGSHFVRIYNIRLRRMAQSLHRQGLRMN
jgi:hypothetical protein